MLTNAQATRNLRMFGVEDIDRFLAAQEESRLRWLTSPQMLLTSALSDVQEMIERDQHEDARQAINRIKMMLTKYVSNEMPPLPPRETK